MKSILEASTREEVIKRIESLNVNIPPQWGKMNSYQMFEHCAMWQEMLLGKREYKQSLLGKIFGKIALKDMMKDTPMKANMPTVGSFKITGNGDAQAAKAKWIALIKQHATQSNTGILHPFFGKLTAEQAGQLAYKHIDHHLKQFNS